MSSIIVKGNIGSDPELKWVKRDGEDVAVVSFSVAYTPKSKKDGKYTEGETTWYRVTQWRDKAEAAADNFQKGDKVLVWGTLKQSTYEAKDGTKKTSLEINADEVGRIYSIKPKNKWDEPGW
jgi:single-strand DNA-binding protein